MSKPLPACLKVFLLLLSFFTKASLAQPPVITYQPLITGLNRPIDIVDAGDGSNRLFIVEQPGTVRVWNGTSLLATPFTNIASRLSTGGGEQGLLSMAFHPRYDTNGYFFLYYTNTAGDIELARGKVSAADPNVANPDSFWVMMSIPKPFSNHNGGDLNFGPDGMLYFATGDGGAANDPGNNAQTGSSRLGKMLRLNVDSFYNSRRYVIPPDNPFIGNAAFDSAVYAYGLRNPFRWSFDRQTGNMWIGDVGQDIKEEVNFRPAGGTAGINYGWRCFEGTVQNASVPLCDPTNDILPIFEYNNPPGAPAAVTGGFVYRGTDYPNFRGYYIAADVYSGNIYTVYPSSGGYTSSTQSSPINIVVSFGEDEEGELYAASQSTNTVYRVVATGGGVLPVTLTAFSARTTGSINELQWTTGYEQNTARFHIEYSTNGTGFQRAGTVAASRISNGSAYTYRHHYSSTGDVFYRLAIQDDDGSTRYSAILRLGTGKAGIKINPTLVRNKTIQLQSGNPSDQLRLVNTSGQVVFEKRLNGFTGTMIVHLPSSLVPGMYVVQVTGSGQVIKEKIFVE